MNSFLPQGSALEPERPERPVRALFTKAGLAGIVYITVTLSVNYIAVLLTTLLWGPEAAYSPAALISFSVIPYAFTIPAVYLIMRSGPKESREQKKKFRWFYLPGAFTVCILFGQLGAYAGNLLSQLLQDTLNIPISDPLQTQVTGSGLWANFILLALAAPILEEIVFRKLILGHLTAYGTGIAIFCSAFIFALIHCNLYQFFYAFFIGLVLGAVYCRTGRVIYTILLHALFNLYSGVLPAYLGTGIEKFDPALVFVNAWQAVYLVYMLSFILLAAAGLVTLIFYINKRKSALAEAFANFGHHFAPACCNAGMMILFILCLFINLCNIFLMI